tara:strand:+ start:157 stop:408 length:252 start_codon:yes stop_codon:yes gene_type:complete
MAQQKKYKDIGKKDLMNVMSQMIQKIEAIEMTLNILVMFVDKDKKFNEFMQEALKPKEGGDDELQSNEATDGNRDNSNSNESA